MARPVMIALLGVDGSGRTNQAKALAERLRRRGVRARYFENAGGRPLWNRLARALGRADGLALFGVPSIRRWRQPCARRRWPGPWRWPA
ncbi:hypothetical protein ACWEOR_25665 [Micromonospora chalcea]